MSIRPLAIALAFVLASPVAAQAKQVTMPPGSSSNWVQQQPTRFLDADAAQVLPDDLAYVSAGGALGAGGLNYSRGMGNGGELGFGVNAGFPFGGAFTGGISGAWKQQLSRTASLAIAVRPSVLLAFAPATSLGVGVGLPFTFDAGNGHLTVEPRVQFANISTPNAGNGDVALGYQTPLTDRWSLLAEVDPTFSFGGAGFSLPLSAGARFSPTATSHVDFQVLNMTATPAVTGSVGLVGVTGHVGF
ncbi:MAG: hypothetical protein JWM80_963 [Cyanobacteria bacterium RYN_339]|nr:hypothetical protein [Cyanobacteria bacterium RYN_339]